MLMASSVLLLILTGFFLWFLGRPDLTWWQRESMTSLISIGLIRFVHRCAATLMILVSTYHLAWVVFTKNGRREFLQLVPRKKDFLDCRDNLLFFLGRSKERPKFTRYAYFEKFDYWGAYWGCIVMILTGLVLWFDRFFAGLFPWFPYELAIMIHMYEAILATMVHLIWHFYNVHFRPDIFPGSKVWLTGEMTREQMLEEHPLEYEEHLRKSDP
jgi:cytochrome b subunit of formate dehydrogenase